MLYLKVARATVYVSAIVVLFLTAGCPPSPQAAGPAAAFSASVQNGATPLAVQFTDSSSPGNSAITSWAWNFGDGGTSAQQNPSHTYTNAGTYTVSLTVTNASGTDTASKPGFIVATNYSAGDVQTIMLPGNVPLVMVWIPAGTFMMGAYPNELDSGSYERPQHQVTVPGFWMGKYEVTQAQWTAIMGSNPSYFQGANAGGVDTSNRPVEQVSWNDVKSFIAALNSDTGSTFRLPSEAEWEYACRAGTTTRFYWGDDLNYDPQFFEPYAWYGNDSNNRTHNVGGRLPNAWGLYDMSGNVEEWCEDDFHYSYTGAPTDGSAWVDSPRGPYRVVRGGGYGDAGAGCRSAFRDYDPPTYTHMDVGFRLAN